MTEVIFFKSAECSDTLVGFHVYGHSGFADSGEDIVCSAISSAVIMTANTITDIFYARADVSADNDGDVRLMLKEQSEACEKLLQGLKLHLLELEKQYSGFINVKFTEV